MFKFTKIAKFEPEMFKFTKNYLKLDKFEPKWYKFTNFY
jgi:hypothetical protein